MRNSKVLAMVALSLALADGSRACHNIERKRFLFADGCTGVVVIAHLVLQIQTILLALFDGLSQKAGIAGFNEILVLASCLCHSDFPLFSDCCMLTP